MREESFVRLYEVLSNREAQDIIRAESPGAKHCPFLIESPDACTNLPEHYREKAGGAVCPHNPFFNPQLIPKFEAAERNAPLIEDAFVIRDMLRTRTLPAIERLDPCVFQAARIMAEWDRAKTLEIQARMSGFGATREPEE